MNSLRITRIKKGITQTELGSVTGLSQCSISKIERGMVKGNLTTKHKIEAIIGKIDWTETEGVHLRGDYSEAEMLIKQLVSITLGMAETDQKAIKKLIHKYFKSTK